VQGLLCYEIAPAWPPINQNSSREECKTDDNNEADLSFDNWRFEPLYNPLLFWAEPAIIEVAIDEVSKPLPPAQTMAPVNAGRGRGGRRRKNSSTTIQQEPLLVSRPCHEVGVRSAGHVPQMRPIQATEHLPNCSSLGQWSGNKGRVEAIGCFASRGKLSNPPSVLGASNTLPEARSWPAPTGGGRSNAHRPQASLTELVSALHPAKRQRSDIQSVPSDVPDNRPQAWLTSEDVARIASGSYDLNF